jgi:hypothetical protein
VVNAEVSPLATIGARHERSLRSRARRCVLRRRLSHLASRRQLCTMSAPAVLITASPSGVDRSLAGPAADSGRSNRLRHEPPATRAEPQRPSSDAFGSAAAALHHCARVLGPHRDESVLNNFKEARRAAASGFAGVPTMCAAGSPADCKQHCLIAAARRARPGAIASMQLEPIRSTGGERDSQHWRRVSTTSSLGATARGNAIALAAYTSESRTGCKRLRPIVPEHLRPTRRARR